MGIVFKNGSYIKSVVESENIKGEGATMQNILSYINKPLTGAEIKIWIVEHTSHETEYSHITKSMLRYMNLSDKALYKVVLNPSGTGAGEQKRYKPNVVKLTNEG